MELASTGYQHSGLETSCQECHEKDRPAAVNGQAHGGGGDCIGCHNQAAWRGSGAGTFSHTPTPTSCASCHNADRPVGPAGARRFDHSITVGMGDCVGCHAGRAGVDWTAAVYPHTPVPTSCNSCHSTNRPLVTRYPGSNANVAGHYDLKDCNACHVSRSATVTRFLFQHSNSVNQNINFCLPCHLQDGRDEHQGDNRVNLTGDGNCFDCHRTRRSWRRN